MKGFFKKENLKKSASNCSKCKLHKECNTPYIGVAGEGKKSILIINESPEKDKKGKLLQGESIEILREAFNEYGIDIDVDCWVTNAVSCRPPKGRAPHKREVKMCNPRVQKVVEELKPKMIFLLGSSALDSFLMDKIKGSSGGIDKWRGFVIPDQVTKAWIIPLYHPTFVRDFKKKKKIVPKIFEQDIGRGLRKIKERCHVFNHKVEVLSQDNARHMLKTLLDNPPPKMLAFDYETTGIKPYKEGHEIICVGVCCSDIAYVFLLDDKRVLSYWKKILRTRSIPKTAQNIKFEHVWSRVILGTIVKGWKHDTMQASHIIDNRKGITGLKFQSYIRFGQGDYSSHLDKYIKTTGEEEFNTIRDAPMNEVYKYCAMDAILEYKLAILQMEGEGIFNE
jgi:DNA polymerase